MTISPDDSLFAWVKAQLTISAITNIVGTDGICRDDWAESQKPDPPRVEYNPFRYGSSEDGNMYTGQFGITVICDRAIAYGSNASPVDEGDAWTLEASVLSSLNGVQPTSITGYTFSPIEVSARRRPTRTPDDIVGRRLNFGIVAYPGTDPPLSGGDAELTGLSANLKIIGWDISVESTSNTDFTDVNMSVLSARTDRPIGRVQIRVRIIGDGVTIFPAHGSRQAITFQAKSTSWENSVLIQRVQWVPNADKSSSPQFAVISGIIDYGETALLNTATATFTGEAT